LVAAFREAGVSAEVAQSLCKQKASSSMLVGFAQDGVQTGQLQSSVWAAALLFPSDGDSSTEAAEDV
jgi:hypothetical protein